MLHHQLTRLHILSGLDAKGGWGGWSQQADALDSSQDSTSAFWRGQKSPAAAGTLSEASSRAFGSPSSAVNRVRNCEGMDDREWELRERVYQQGRRFKEALTDIYKWGKCQFSILITILCIMTSVWKRLQRVGKKASKFQFVASYQELTLECSKKWWVHPKIHHLSIP